MKQTSLIPANFDETNLSEDAVLGNIFDDEYTSRPVDEANIHMFVGFIKNEPCVVNVEACGNKLTIRFAYSLSLETKKAVKARLLKDYGDGIKARVHYDCLSFTDFFSVEYFLDENYF